MGGPDLRRGHQVRLDAESLARLVARERHAAFPGVRGRRATRGDDADLADPRRTVGLDLGCQRGLGALALREPVEQPRPVGGLGYRLRGDGTNSGPAPCNN